VVQAAVTAGARPNSIDPWYTTYARESVLFGRRFGDEWFAYAQLQHAWHGFDVKSDTMAPAFTRYHDIIGVFGAQMDTRNRRYNPSRGLYQWNRCAVTHTVAHDSLDYVQLFSGIAYYTPGVWQDNTVALRMALLLRSDDPGRFKRLAFGGDFPLRGFATSGVYTLNDKNASINNAVLANAEYRFPLFSMPPVIVPSYFLSSDPVLTVQYHVDGALFTDLGYFWHHASAPGSEYGYAGALGAGLRLRVPLVKSAVSFDMAWPVLARGIRGYTGSLFPEGIPYLHMYVGIPF
jgi:outer membrane protein assembly factor BamA